MHYRVARYVGCFNAESKLMWTNLNFAMSGSKNLKKKKKSFLRTILTARGSTILLSNGTLKYSLQLNSLVYLKGSSSKAITLSIRHPSKFGFFFSFSDKNSNIFLPLLECLITDFTMYSKSDFFSCLTL